MVYLRSLPLIRSSSPISISSSPFFNRINILNPRSHLPKLLRFHHHHHHQHHLTAFIATMSEESNPQSQLAGESESPSTFKEEAAAEKPPGKSPPIPLPPPPEKPLPGDCCGSGCVRCVWDIYYDELEDYNKLCKSNSNFNSEAKPS